MFSIIQGFRASVATDGIDQIPQYKTTIHNVPLCPQTKMSYLRLMHNVPLCPQTKMSRLRFRHATCVFCFLSFLSTKYIITAYRYCQKHFDQSIASYWFILHLYWSRLNLLTQETYQCWCFNGHGVLLVTAQCMFYSSQQEVFLVTELRAPGVMHNSDVMMSTMASQITGVSSVCSMVCSGADQRMHQRPLWGECTGDRRLLLTKDQ